MHLSGNDGRVHRWCAACLRAHPALVEAMLRRDDEADDETRAEVSRLVARLIERLPAEADEADDAGIADMEMPQAFDVRDEVSLETREEWRQRLRAWSRGIQLMAPALSPELAATEAALGTKLPAELRAILAATNGVRTIDAIPIWPTRTIVESNRLFREELADVYMPFDSLLFFGDNGKGDHYAYRIVRGEVDEGNVYCWHHQTDSRVWLSFTIEQLLEHELQRAEAA
jgi:hypothetical protein